MATARHAASNRRNSSDAARGGDQNGPNTSARALGVARTAFRTPRRAAATRSGGLDRSRAIGSEGSAVPNACSKGRARCSASLSTPRRDAARLPTSFDHPRARWRSSFGDFDRSSALGSASRGRSRHPARHPTPFSRDAPRVRARPKAARRAPADPFTKGKSRDRSRLSDSAERAGFAPAPQRASRGMALERTASRDAIRVRARPPGRAQATRGPIPQRKSRDRARLSYSAERAGFEPADPFLSLPLSKRVP